MVSRIAARFAELAGQGRKALITYIVAGDPCLDITVPMMHRMVGDGADIIELGVPFSDPMSEGPVIQLAHERALAQGTSLRDVLSLVDKFREKNTDTPVLLMGYANPVEHMGYQAFADQAARAGVDALLTVDLPPEEISEASAQLRRVGMDNILLVAPTSPQQRVERIVRQASGFVYYVSLKGVTGSGNLDVDSVRDGVARIRQHTDLPVAVGFGIKDAASARAIAATADGVVVGSAVVNRAAEAIAAGGDHADAINAVGALLRELRQGVDGFAS
jgi:tryptophan synthase alpha chain